MVSLFQMWTAPGKVVRQVVHRDFKTSNILVDQACNGRVADFGLARRMKSRCGGGVHEPLPPECTVVMGTWAPPFSLLRPLALS